MQKKSKSARGRLDSSHFATARMTTMRATPTTFPSTSARRPSTSPSRRPSSSSSSSVVVRASAASASASARLLDRHLPVDRYSHDGLRQVHASPDVFVVDDFLSTRSCDELVRRAREKGDMTQSPVVYAGWTSDVERWTSTTASGPAVWMGALTMLIGSAAFGQSGLGLLAEGVAMYFGAVGAAYLGGVAYVKKREAELRELRTSTSTALDGTGFGELELIEAVEKLLPGTSRSRYEAPTVIRYERGQKLAPHFDANRCADAEDANRGGQTLATVLVYLNDVDNGGQTVFGRLDGQLGVAPRRGRALVFFPANAAGDFDDRVEHEGAEALDEKWIVRVWVHENEVKKPYGLVDCD